MTFYNEIEPFACAWLRELMKAGCITEGVVDERSIEDVAPDDLRRSRRCHFFSGIGVWDYALRLAGFPADRPVWTASCPCQPFSQAGRRGGTDDARHLWPALFWLISQCRPELCFGEQVASPDGYAWLDVVCADLESLGYTVGTVVTPAASFGAPHGRHRIYWVAKSNDNGTSRDLRPRRRQPEVVRSSPANKLAVSDGQLGGQGSADGRKSDAGSGTEPRPGPCGGGESGRVANDTGTGQRRRKRGSGERAADESERLRDAGELGDTIGSRIRGSGHGEIGGTSGGVSSETREQRVRADSRPDGSSLGAVADTASERCEGDRASRVEVASEPSGPVIAARGPGAVNGFWGNALWLPCTDGKQRPVEPGLISLADGLAGQLGLVRLASYPDRPTEERLIYAPLIQKGKARAGRLRGYGNAICAPQAAAFIQAFLQAEADEP